MTCQGMDPPQTPHRDAELLRHLHLHRAGPMEAIPEGVLPGQLSRSPVNAVQFLDSAMVAIRRTSSFNGLQGKDSSENHILSRLRFDAISAGSLGRGRQTA